MKALNNKERLLNLCKTLHEFGIYYVDHCTNFDDFIQVDIIDFWHEQNVLQEDVNANLPAIESMFNILKKANKQEK